MTGPIRLFSGSLLALLIGVSSASAQAQTPVPTVPFLPDTFVILRVGDRAVTVRDYLDRWFSTWPEDRPSPDSAGRVQFLNTLMNRELLAKVATRGNPTLAFEQRNQLRAYRNYILAYVLRLRTVDDSVRITPTEQQRVREAARYEYQYRLVVFEDSEMARQARTELIAGKPLDQVRRNYVTITVDHDEKSWTSSHRLHPQYTAYLCLLEPKEFSKPFVVPEGVALVQLLGRRPTKEVASNTQVVENFLRSARVEERTEEVMSNIRRTAGVVYDTTNVRWLAAQFQKSRKPRILLADTGRVLVQGPSLRFSVKSFTHDYWERAPILRPDVSTFDLLRRAIDDMILQPAKVDLALQRGLENDPIFLKLLEEKREGLLIEAFFRDSIAAKVQPKPADRRKYYEKNQAKYLTYATAHYAVLRGPTLAEAGLLATRIRAGEKATDILNEMTANGKRVGRIGELRENEADPYHDVLFAELRPGEVKVFGPDENGEFFALQLTAFDSGRQLSYEEAEAYVDEALRTQLADQQLESLLAREKRGVRIESRPDQVMRIVMKDPAF